MVGWGQSRAQWRMEHCIDPIVVLSPNGEGCEASCRCFPLRCLSSMPIGLVDSITYRAGGASQRKASLASHPWRPGYCRSGLFLALKLGWVPLSLPDSQGCFTASHAATLQPTSRMPFRPPPPRRRDACCTVLCCVCGTVPQSYYATAHIAIQPRDMRARHGLATWGGNDLRPAFAPFMALKDFSSRLFYPERKDPEHPGPMDRAPD